MILFLLVLAGLVIGVSLVLLPSPEKFAVPFALLIGVLSAAFPAAVVLFLLGMTPFRILWQGGGIAPQELLYSLTFLWFLGFSFVREFLKGAPFSGEAWKTPIALPVFCMGMVGLWGTAVAILRGHPFAHWTSDLNFILFFWLYFAVALRFQDTRDIYRVFWPALWITAGVIVWGVFWRIQSSGLFAGLTPGFPRGMAFGNSFFILTLCLFLFSEAGTLRRKGFLGLALFFGLHQFMSFVRVTWVSQIGTLGFLMCVLPVTQKRRFVRWGGTFFVILSLLFVASWMIPTENRFVKMPIYLMDRFMSIFVDTTGTGPTMQTRYSEWAAALKTYLRHPLTGNGLGTEIQYIRYDFTSYPVTTERYIHSSYIYYLLNTGPVGLLVFLWFCWRAARYGMGVYRRIPDSEVKGLALGLTAAFVFQIFSSLAGNELNNPSRTIWTGFFLGSLAVLDRTEGKV